MSERSGGWGVAFAGLCLGAGLAFGAWTIGSAMAELRSPPRIVTVKGLSERIVEADTATWRAPFRGLGDTQEQAISAAISARDAVLTLGRDGGLTPEAMSVEPFSMKVERYYVQSVNGGQEERMRYIATGAVRMRSSEPDLVARLAERTAELLDRGVLLGGDDYSGVSGPVYIFSGLNGIKPDMIAEATKNARAAADQFANDSGSSVGRIINARQGAVEIVAADGEYDERTERRKLVRLVSTVDYELVD
ncbi:MAG: SIMPL domain-containing protein [Pikeienuella sp.]